MGKIKARRLLGLAGVAVTEDLFTQKVSGYFEWYMLCIAFWLPIQWYLQVRGYIPRHVLVGLDWFVWASFVLETGVLALLVKRKWYYFSGNWMNLLIIVVACPILYEHYIGFAALRMIRLLILLRIIVPWMRSAHNMLTLNRIGLSLFIFFIATSLSGVIVSTFDSGISNPFQGIWWAWETVTTVGYGDVVPTTPAGKIIAMIIMVLGIVLFSVVTATVSAYFMGRDKKTELYNIIEINHNRLKEIEKKLEQLRDKIDFNNTDKLDHFVRSLSVEEQQALLQALQKQRLADKVKQNQ